MANGVQFIGFQPLKADPALICEHGAMIARRDFLGLQDKPVTTSHVSANGIG